MDKKLHNLVHSIVLAPQMREIRNEFMPFIRGYLRPRKEDEELFRRCEHSMRDIAEVVLSERDRNEDTCPSCGNKAHLVFKDCETLKDRDGNKHVVHTAICEKCNAKVHSVYRYLGCYTQEEKETMLQV